MIVHTNVFGHEDIWYVNKKKKYAMLLDCCDDNGCRGEEFTSALLVISKENIVRVLE